MSGTVYWSCPTLPFGIVSSTFSPTTFLEIAVCKTSQYEISGKNHICSRLQNSPYFGIFKYKHFADFFTGFEKKPTVLQSTFAQSKRFLQCIIYPPEKKFIETSSILAWGKSPLLPTNPVFTLEWFFSFSFYSCIYLRSTISLLIWLFVIIITLTRWSANLSLSHSYFSFGTICGRPLEITWGRGSFAVHFGDHLWPRDHLRLGIICGTAYRAGSVVILLRFIAAEQASPAHVIRRVWMGLTD